MIIIIYKGSIRHFDELIKSIIFKFFVVGDLIIYSQIGF